MGSMNSTAVESSYSPHLWHASIPERSAPPKPSCSTAPPSPTGTASLNSPLLRSRSFQSIPLPPLLELGISSSGARVKDDGIVRSTAVAFDDEPSPPAISQAVTVQTSKWISSCPIYRDLNQSDSEFRLLYLQPSPCYSDAIYTTLEYCSLARPPRYLALSYCWGEKPGRCHISVNGTPFAITRNLDHALRQLRSHGYDAVWVDALCIDQNDLEERSLQVNRMPAIYRKAAQVGIWLGREAHGSDHVMRKLGTPNGFQSVSLPQFQCFLERPYWKRTWVVQEIVFATRLTIFCGSHVLEWEWIESQLGHLKWFDELDTSQLQYLKTLCELRISRRKRKPTHFLELFRKTRYLRSTDRRDKIFAILGLAFDGPDFVAEPNYRLSEYNLCISVTRTAIKVHESLDMILLAPGQPEESDLPSWCPDYMSINTHPFPANIIDYLHGKSRKWRFGTRSTRWRATGGSRLSSPNFNVEDGILEVYGRSIGQLASLSAPADCEEPGNEIYSFRSAPGSDLSALDALCRVFKIYDPQYSTQTKQKHIFPYLWAALEPHGEAIFEEAMSTQRTHPNDKYCAPNCQAIVNWFRLNANFTIQGKTLKEWACMTGAAAPAQKFRGYVRQAPTCDDDPDRVAMMDILDEGLRLITTEHDHLGWAHPESMPGDWVYLLEGCSVPVVLRYDRDDRTFQLIGHAYVDGFMDGRYWQGTIKDDYPLAKLELQ